jgi:hypothetical protein
MLAGRDRKKKTDDMAASDAYGISPKKRSKLKLIIFALAPLALAGVGYAGWTRFLAAAPAEAAGHGEQAAEAGAAGGGDQGEQGEPGADAIRTAAVPSDAEAQTSFTHSYALSVLLERRCGRYHVPALKAASDEEALAKGLLATMSWAAATRRVEGLTEKSCDLLSSEILDADARAAEIAAEKAKAAKGGHAEAHH